MVNTNQELKAAKACQGSNQCFIDGNTEIGSFGNAQQSETCCRLKLGRRRNPE